MNRGGRIIGRKRKRNALLTTNNSQTNQSSSNIDIISGKTNNDINSINNIDLDALPPTKRLKTSHNVRNNNTTQHHNSQIQQPRVFGSNLTNLTNVTQNNNNVPNNQIQSKYHLRSRSNNINYSNINNNIKSQISKPDSKMAPIIQVDTNNKGRNVLKNVGHKADTNINLKNVKKNVSKHDKENISLKQESSSDEEEDIDIDIADAGAKNKTKKPSKLVKTVKNSVNSVNNDRSHSYDIDMASKQQGGTKVTKRVTKGSKMVKRVSKHSSKNVKNKNEIEIEPSKLLKSNSSKVLKLGAWDKFNMDNDLECVEYCGDIMKHLFIAENEYCNFENSNSKNNSKNSKKSVKNGIIDNNYNFMEWQKDITDKMRLILLDWITGVHRKFKLVQQCLFLTVNILDRYLAVKQVNRNSLQLVGCACLWIATKYHEIYAPECNDFVYISDGAFTRDNLLSMEKDICCCLSFRLTVPTPMTFAQRFIKIGTFEIEKQFIKYAEIMFDRYLKQSAIQINSNDNNTKQTRKMYIKGICELLNNGFNRSISKFGEIPTNRKKKDSKFGLTVGLQGIRSDMIDHIGNVLRMCDVIRQCKNEIESKEKNNNKTGGDTRKFHSLINRLRKELLNKYGISNDTYINHIISIKDSMQDVLEKIDILCHLTYYLIEHGLLDYESGLSRILPSKLASSAIAYSLLGCGILNEWPQYLIDATGYDLNQLLPIMKKLEIARQNKKHKAIQSKYEREQFARVTKLSFDKMNLNKFFN